MAESSLLGKPSAALGHEEEGSQNILEKFSSLKQSRITAER